MRVGLWGSSAPSLELIPRIDLIRLITDSVSRISGPPCRRLSFDTGFGYLGL
jgi:hypothetical protein